MFHGRINSAVRRRRRAIHQDTVSRVVLNATPANHNMRIEGIQLFQSIKAVGVSVAPVAGAMVLAAMTITALVSDEMVKLKTKS
jgi:hypothetical protein